MKKQKSKIAILLSTIFALALLMLTAKISIAARPLENDVEVRPETELTYYLAITYDGVDVNGTESSDSVTSEVRGGLIYVEDKIPEGLEFMGFVTTRNGTIGATQRNSEVGCSGRVVDDTREATVDSGTWNDEHTEYYYHGLHYTVADRTVRFTVKNLKAGGVLKVGIITKTPTIDDPATEVVETRRDFYNFASAVEGALRAISNTVHVFMGEPEATLYNVRYEYTGTLPENNVPELPATTSYAEGAEVGVASPVEIEGYSFSGWTGKTEATETNPNGTDITVNENGSFTMPNENVVFTGSFTQLNNKHSVTYQIEGVMPEGYIVPLTKQYFEGAQVTLDSLKAGDKLDRKSVV